MPVKVALSPFYGKYQWKDEVTQTIFSRSVTSNIEVVDISNIGDYSGIRKAVRLNVLQIIEGVLPDETNQAHHQTTERSVSTDSRYEDSNNSVQSTRTIPTEVIVEEVVVDAEESKESNEAETSEDGDAPKAEANKKEEVGTKQKRTTSAKK